MSRKFSPTMILKVLATSAVAMVTLSGLSLAEATTLNRTDFNSQGLSSVTDPEHLYTPGPHLPPEEVVAYVMEEDLEGGEEPGTVTRLEFAPTSTTVEEEEEKSSPAGGKTTGNTAIKPPRPKPIVTPEPSPQPEEPVVPEEPEEVPVDETPVANFEFLKNPNPRDNVLLSQQNGFRFDEKIVLKKDALSRILRGTVEYVQRIDGVETVHREIKVNRIAADNGYSLYFKSAAKTPVRKTSEFFVRFTETDARNKATGVVVTSSPVSIKWAGPVATKGKNSNLKNTTKKLTVSGTYGLWATLDHVSGVKRTGVLQKYNTSTKKWVNLRSLSMNNTTGKATAFIHSADTSGKYRLYFNGTDIYKAFSTTAITIDRAKRNPTITAYGADRYKYMVGSSNYMRFYVSGFAQQSGQQLLFQQYVPSSKKWVTRTTKKNPKAGTHAFLMTKGSSATKTQKLQYRLVFKGTATHNQKASKSVYSWIENSRYYTGLKKEFYNLYKSKCPTIVPALDSSLAKRGIAGLAHLKDGVSTFSTKVAKKHRRTVALHECAHHKQYIVAGKNGGWGKFVATAKKQLGWNGMEWNADCIANHWAKNSYWGYKNPNICKKAAGKRWTTKVIKGQRPW